MTQRLPDTPLAFVPGKIGRAAQRDGQTFINAVKAANFNYLDPFTPAAWIYPTAPNGAIMSSVEDQHQGQGYGLYLRDGKLRFHYTVRWTDLGMRLETTAPLELNRRNPAQSDKLAYCFLDQFPPRNVQQARQSLADVRRSARSFMTRFRQ